MSSPPHTESSPRRSRSAADRRLPVELPSGRVPGALDLLVHFEPASPAIGAGLRAATATIVPLLLGYFLKVPAMDWASVAGFTAALVDPGGAYHRRAVAMGTFTLVGAGSGLAAALAGQHPWLAVALVFLWAAGGTLASVYGSTGASVGPSAAIVFIASLAAPADLHGAIERSAFLAAGGLWAMVLALVLWPLRPYRPARRAIARVYRALADYADRVGTEPAGRSRAARLALAKHDHARIRESIEEARGALLAVRRGRRGESGRGERLLALLEGAELTFATLVALDDVFEGAADPRLTTARTVARRTVCAFGGTARDVALVVEAEGRPLSALPVAWDPSALLAALEAAAKADAGADAAVARAQYAYAADLLARLREYTTVAADTASSLEDESAPPAAALASSFDPEPARSVWAPLRENLTFRSVELRHALRVGLVAAAAVWATRALGLPHGTWVTTTTLGILQPQAGLTFVKGAQRVAGTVLGGIITAALGAAVHDPLWILVLAFLLSALCVAVLPINYLAFSALLTPAFVLLAEASSGDWRLAWVRITNTLVGGALALAGARLLWPTSEREAVLPEQVAAALRAAGDYLRRALGGPNDAGGGGLAAARRAVGLAAINAETSFQRLLAEWRGGRGADARALEPVMTLLTYTRRFAAAVTALAPPARPASAPRPRELGPFVEAAAGTFEEMASAAAAGRAPAPIPARLAALAAESAAAMPDDIVFRAQLDRVVRQVTILHGAVARMYFAAAGRERRGERERRGRD